MVIFDWFEAWVDPFLKLLLLIFIRPPSLIVMNPRLVSIPFVNCWSLVTFTVALFRTRAFVWLE